MASFWTWVDRTWVQLASVRLTLVIFVGLLVLSIPGTILLQYNISNVDPGLQYSYDFWRFGRAFQLFSSYHSFWYVGLIVILSMNLIACSVERWPQMWKLAKAKPVALSPEAIALQPAALRHSWTTSLDAVAFKNAVLAQRGGAVVVDERPGVVQLFWQAGRWSRVANYLVHTSLLVIFAGAIGSSLYGFEGALNIPTGGAVDSFLLFKEGKAAGLEEAPGGVSNERMFGFRIEAEDFQVNFHEKIPTRPKEFLTRANIIENGRIVKKAEIRVNEPLEYAGFTFYQSSFGRMGDFDVQLRLVDKRKPFDGQVFVKTRLGEPRDLGAAWGGKQLVAMRGLMNVQGLGPGVQFQEFDGTRPAGKPFWVLKDYPQFDFIRRDSAYGVVVEEVKELFYTGLQVGHDPGAPVYWLGCFGMLLGTFYALFVTHRKYYVRFDNGRVDFVGTVHRLPLSFEKKVAALAADLKRATGAKENS